MKIISQPGKFLLAFFELPTKPPMGLDPNTPSWTQHLALEVGSIEELLATKARLEADGIAIELIPDND